MVKYEEVYLHESRDAYEGGERWGEYCELWNREGVGEPLEYFRPVWVYFECELRR